MTLLRGYKDILTDWKEETFAKHMSNKELVQNIGRNLKTQYKDKNPVFKNWKMT